MTMVPICSPTHDGSQLLTSCSTYRCKCRFLAQNLHATFPGGVTDPSVTNMDLYTYHSYNTVRSSSITASCRV
jgi:hypothetical protein